MGRSDVARACAGVPGTGMPGPPPPPSLMTQRRAAQGGPHPQLGRGQGRGVRTARLPRARRGMASATLLRRRRLTWIRTTTGGRRTRGVGGESRWRRGVARALRNRRDTVEHDAQAQLFFNFFFSAVQVLPSSRSSSVSKRCPTPARSRSVRGGRGTTHFTSSKRARSRAESGASGAPGCRPSLVVVVPRCPRVGAGAVEETDWLS